jgi:hypothetical protein
MQAKFFCHFGTLSLEVAASLPEDSVSEMLPSVASRAASSSGSSSGLYALVGRALYVYFVSAYQVTGGFNFEHQFIQQVSFPLLSLTG